MTGAVIPKMVKPRQKADDADLGPRILADLRPGATEDAPARLWETR